MCEPEVYDILVNSRDRVSGDKTNFTVMFSGQSRPTKVRVTQAIVPMSMYVFNSNNNRVPFQENIGAAATATITDGNYTPSSLATELATRLTAASPNARTYTVTYSSTTDVMTVSVSAGTFAFLWATLTGSQKVYYNMGYTSSSTSQAATQTNSGGLELSIGAVLIRVTPLSTANLATNTSDGGYTAMIQTPVNSYGVAYWNEGLYPQDFPFYGSPINMLQVSITGTGGTQVVMRNDWSFTLRVESKR